MVVVVDGGVVVVVDGGGGRGGSECTRIREVIPGKYRPIINESVIQVCYPSTRDSAYTNTPSVQSFNAECPWEEGDLHPTKPAMTPGGPGTARSVNTSPRREKRHNEIKDCIEFGLVALEP